jgi:hypothetical protein
MTESGEEWMEGIFKTFSLSDESGQTLFEHLEDSACILADRLIGRHTKKTRSLYRGLARQYFNAAKGYATAFETLNNDPVISWFMDNGALGPDKIELLRKKKENLCETIQTLEKLIPRKPNHAVEEKVTRGANLRKSRKKQSKKEAHEILEEAASFFANNKRES